MTNWMRMGTKRIAWGVLLSTLVIALSFSACSKKEEPAAPGVTPEAKAPAAAPKAEPAKPALPPLVDVLQYKPDSAILAMAFVSATDVYDNTLMLMKRFAPMGVDVNALIDQAVQEAKVKGDFGDANSFPEMLRHEGIEPDAPMGIYVSVQATLESLKQAANAAPETPQEPTAEGEQDEQQPQASTPDAEAAPKSPQEMEQEVVKVASEMAPPEIAALVGVSDRAAVEKLITDNYAKASGDSASPEEVKEGDVTIYSYGADKAPNYFFFDDRAVIGSSLALVKAVAARIDNPAKIRYGTEDMPVGANDKVATLIRLDMIPPLLEAGLPLAESLNPEIAPMMKMQMAMVDRMRKAYAGDDPMVVTVGWNDDQIEMLARIDTKTHPALLEMAGDAQPLRLAKLYPEGTSALIAVRFNEQMKTQIQESWLNSMPENMQSDPQTFQALMMLRNFMGMLGDELTIGVTGKQQLTIPAMGEQQPTTLDIPRVLVMIGLSEPETLQGLLMMLPSTVKEQYNQVDIKEVALPIPVKVYFAILNKTLVVDSNLDELKQTMDRVQSGEATGLFASLDPPLSVDQPRYSLVFLRGQLYDVFAGMAAGDPELAQYLQKVTGQIKMLESRQEQMPDQIQSRVDLYLAPMAPAAK